MTGAIQRIVWFLVFCSGLVVYFKKLISNQFFILLVILIWLVFVLFLKKEKNLAKEVKIFFLFVFVSIFSFGILGLFRLDQKIYQPVIVGNYNREVILSGKVSAVPDNRIQAKYFILKIDSLKTDGQEYDINPAVSIRARIDSAGSIGFGDYLIVSGKIKQPDNFLTSSQRIFEYRNYLLAKGVTAEIFVSEFSVKKESNNPIKFLTNVREKMLKVLLKNSSFSSGAIMSGMILGDQRFINDDLENSFRKSGLIHLLVLSGYNVALVSFAVFIIFGFLKQKPKIIFSIISVFVFLVLTGFQITVIRASLMIMIMLIAKFFGAKYNPIISLGIVCLLVFAFQPYAIIFDLGFVLSVLATAGVLIIVPVLNKIIKPHKYFPKVFREILVFSLATQIMVLPVLAYSIGQISAVSVLANLLIVPMVPIIMFSGILILILDALSISSAFFFGQIASFFIENILKVIYFLANLPGAVFKVPRFSVWFLLSVYFFLGLFVIRFYRKNKLELAKDF